MIKAVLSNASHPEYGQVSVSFPIPNDQYDQTIEMLQTMELGFSRNRDCRVVDLDSPSMSEFPYLYRNSFREAERCGELGKWRSSHQENITCRKDIEAAISAGFDSGRLAEGCAQSVLYRHGFKRVQHVLAVTVRGRRCAGQIDREPLQWSRQIYIPYDSKYSPEFEVQSPAAALNLFAGQAYQEYQALELFGLEHCVSGGDSLDYTGRVLVMSPDTLREECWDARNQIWPRAVLAAPPPPLAVPFMPPALETESRRAGTAPTLSVC